MVGPLLNGSRQPELVFVWYICTWCNHTVDGSEIRRSPVDMVNIPLVPGFHTSQVVQDFFDFRIIFRWVGGKTPAIDNVKMFHRCSRAMGWMMCSSSGDVSLQLRSRGLFRPRRSGR